MPKLACWSCGRQIYTVAPLESLFAEERRCPRCGAYLRDDRREYDRRALARRQIHRTIRDRPTNSGSDGSPSAAPGADGVPAACEPRPSRASRAEPAASRLRYSVGCISASSGSG